MRASNTGNAGDMAEYRINVESVKTLQTRSLMAHTHYDCPFYWNAPRRSARATLGRLQRPSAHLGCAPVTVAIRRGITTKSTKTERARVILLPSALADVLDAHTDTAAYTAQADYICHGSDGKPLTPKRFSETFTKIAQGMGLDISLHGLRHSHATMLIAAGVPVKVVSERLGHADVNITQNVYAHVLPHMQQQAVDALNGLKTAPPEDGG